MTPAQAQALRLAGASHLQGYLFSRPVPADQARAMAETGVLGFEGAEVEPRTGTHA